MDQNFILDVNTVLPDFFDFKTSAIVGSQAGPMQTMLNYVSPQSLSTNNVVFEVPVLAQNTVMKPNLKINFPFTLSFTATKSDTTTAWDTLYNSNTISLKPDPLSQILSNVTVDYNGANMQREPEITQTALNLYRADLKNQYLQQQFPLPDKGCRGDYSDYYYAGVNQTTSISSITTTTSTYDALQTTYDSPFTLEPQRTSQWMPRSASIVSFSYPDTSSAIGTITLNCFLVYHLPWQMFGANASGIVDVRSYRITLQLTNNLARLLAVRSSNSQSISSGISNLVLGYQSTDKPQLIFETVAMPANLYNALRSPTTPNSLRPICYPTHFHNITQGQVITVTNQTSTPFSTNVINLSIMPSKIYLFFKKFQNGKSIEQVIRCPDNFGVIQNLTATVGSTQTILGTNTRQLYDLSLKNGLSHTTYSEFNNGMCVVCIDCGEDIPLGNDVTMKQGNYTFQFTGNVSTYGVSQEGTRANIPTTMDLTPIVVAVWGTAMINESGVCTKYDRLADDNRLVQAAVKVMSDAASNNAQLGGSVVGGGMNQGPAIVGGGFWGSLWNGIKKVAGFVGKVAPAVSTVLPEFSPIINTVGHVATGVSNLGGSIVGGAKRRLASISGGAAAGPPTKVGLVGPPSTWSNP